MVIQSKNNKQIFTQKRCIKIKIKIMTFIWLLCLMLVVLVSAFDDNSSILRLQRSRKYSQYKREIQIDFLYSVTFEP